MEPKGKVFLALGIALFLAAAPAMGQVAFVADGDTAIGDPLDLRGDGNSPDPIELGSYSVVGNVHTVVGGGDDWWDWGERAHVAYKQMPSGNWRLETSVSELPIPPEAFGDYDGWVKAGVFVRNSVDIGTLGDERQVNALMAALRSDRNESSFQWRPNDDNNWMGNTQYKGAATAPPQKLALQRYNLYDAVTLVEGFVDFGQGVGWERVNGQVLSNLVDEPYAGLAVTAHRNAAGHTLTVDFTDPTFVDPVAPVLAEAWVPPALAPGGMGYVSVREVLDKGGIGDQGACQAALSAGDGTIVDYTAPVFNIHDSSGQGHFTGQQSPYGVVTAGHATAGSADNVSVVVQGEIGIAEGGEYTFGVNSDDGFTLFFPGQVFTGYTNASPYITDNGLGMQVWGGRGSSDSLGVINLPAGKHPFWLTYHEGGGGGTAEFFAAKGAHTSVDMKAGLWNLVGGDMIPGAPAVQPPAVKDGWEVVCIYDPPAGSLDEAKANVEAYWDDPTSAADANTAIADVINYEDDAGGGGGGKGFPKEIFPGADDGVAQNNFAFGARGVLVVTEENDYTFTTFGDDGSEFRITELADGDPDKWTVNEPGRAPVIKLDDGSGFRWESWGQDASGTVHLAPGDYNIEFFWQEGGGGAYIGLWGSMGGSDIFLLGDTTVIPAIPDTAPGLPLVPEPVTLMLLGAGGLGVLLRRRRK